MKNDLQIFSNPDFGDVQMLMINGEPYFIGIEVARILGYAVPKTAVSKVVDKEDMMSTRLRYSGQDRDIIVINESGLYSMIFKSKLESAKKFKKWVTSEVLPSIRKTGGYNSPQTIPEQIRLLAQGNVELNERVEKMEERFNKFEQELPMLPEDADEVHDTINKRVVSLLGGKDSNAYKYKSLTKRLFMDAYWTLKHNFKVSRYKAIKRNQKDKAIEIINSYQPPYFLQMEIDNANAQQSLNI